MRSRAHEARCFGGSVIYMDMYQQHHSGHCWTRTRKWRLLFNPGWGLARMAGQGTCRMDCHHVWCERSSSPCEQGDLPVLPKPIRSYLKVAGLTAPWRMEEGSPLAPLPFGGATGSGPLARKALSMGCLLQLCPTPTWAARNASGNEYLACSGMNDAYLTARV